MKNKAKGKLDREIKKKIEFFETPLPLYWKIPKQKVKLKTISNFRTHKIRWNHSRKWFRFIVMNEWFQSSYLYSHPYAVFLAANETTFSFFSQRDCFVCTQKNSQVMLFMCLFIYFVLNWISDMFHSSFLSIFNSK